MDIPNKDDQIHTFDGGMDSDTAPELIAPNRARFMLNVRSYSFGQKGVITNVKGNTLIETDLPDGTNIAMGWGADESNNQFYFIVYNSNGFHTVYMYDGLKNSVVILIQSMTDSNGVDIMTLNKDYLINHVDIIPSINGPLITWCDGFNKATKFNRNKALDKTLTGYGLIVFKDFITAYKKTSVYAPTCVYFTDVTRNSNFLYGKLFKFCVRFIYDDGEQSNWSDFSKVALPPNQSYSGLNNITYDNNCIQVSIETGNQLVIKIEVAMKVGSLDFVSTSIIDKKTLNIQDNSTYVFNFYNDGADVATDNVLINRLYSFLPDKPFCQAFVKNAMTYSHFYEGFTSINIDIAVSVTYDDLYLPDGTVNQLNHPAFIATLVGNGYNSGSLGINKRYNVQEHFEIGFDVKAGNQYKIFGRNGQSANLYYATTATAADTAFTMANKIKTWLRSIGRGQPVANNGISNEGIDGSGNVSWDYTILGYWDESPVVWSTSVNPINFQTLTDDGLSIQLIKPGSSRKYAVAYQDDDGRVTLANTSDSAVINTGFITEVGDLKRATHHIAISNPPPSFARYYYLLRTPDSGAWIQMLIQKVIAVDPDPTQAAAGNTQKYLDLVVGSLFTYQKLHPNTILVYDFEKEDRLRLIKYYDQTNNDAKILYPYLETEVLSYSINTIEDVNSNIHLNGTDTVQVAGVANASYVGKTLTVNGYQRVIIGAPNANSYQLDSPVPNGTLAQFVVFPNYVITDTRGILRIKQPDGIVVKDLSLVEIYKPQLNNSEDGYKQFAPFGVKLEIGNYGTPQAYHAGTVQDQYQNSPTDPALIDVIEGDAYERNRELPTNNSVPGTQLLVDHVTDPNFSDFYESDLGDLGKIFAQDDGSGVKLFDQRTRFSNNFIEDTRINGLNDFDNLNRKDYNDPYGAIRLTKFSESRLLIFKQLKTAWAGVLSQRIESADGGGSLATSVQLLSDLNYYAWQGGIGDNPESYVSNGAYKYCASANSGVFLRIAGDGCDPISSMYLYDKQAREILSNVQKYNLRIFGGFDRENTEVVWSVPSYNNYLFKGGFIANEWIMDNGEQPTGTTYAILQQPANSTVSQAGQIFTLNTGSVLGDDYFIYQATWPGGSVQPARKECFTVVVSQNRQTGFKVDTDSTFCQVIELAFQARDSSKYCQTEATGFQKRTSSDYCLLEKTATLNISNIEQPSPFIDSNLFVYVDGVQKANLTITDSIVLTVKAGAVIVCEAQSIEASGAPNPVLNLNIKKDGVQIYDNTIPNSPPPTVDFQTTFTAAAGSTYDIVGQSKSGIPLGDFDFMVLRYIWSVGAGTDLDSFTGLINTGTEYDGNPITRENWVGYGQNPDPSTGNVGSGSRVIPYGSSTPYLNWGSDSTLDAGIEAILVDLKQFISDFPLTPNPVSVKMNSVWFAAKESGDITVEVTTYKGGTMALDPATHNFVNTGGVVVDTISQPYNVALQSQAFLITSSQPTAQMDFDKTTNTATLTLK